MKLQISRETGRDSKSTKATLARAQCDIRMCGVVRSEDRWPQQIIVGASAPGLVGLREATQYIMPCRRLWKVALGSALGLPGLLRQHARLSNATARWIVTMRGSGTKRPSLPPSAGARSMNTPGARHGPWRSNPADCVQASTDLGRG